MRIVLLPGLDGTGNLFAPFLEEMGNDNAQVIPLPRSAQLVAIGLVIAAVVISWVSTFLSANVAVKERVMNVLRYD